MNLYSQVIDVPESSLLIRKSKRKKIIKEILEENCSQLKNMSLQD